MADIVTFPCEYLSISSGYEDRLLNKLDEVGGFCSEHGVIPLFISDYINMNPVVIVNGTIDPNGTPDQSQLDICETINKKLTDNQLNGPQIVFRVGNFSNAISVFTDIKSLNYCAMYELQNIIFVRNGDTINIAVVSIDAESG